MGGSLGVESVVNEGSTFWVQLPATNDPLNAEEAQRGFALDANEMPAQGKTVLYIEDNVASYQLMDRLFSRWNGVTLLTAMQGRLGLELARQHHPDLILLDLHLPDMHGLEVIEHLREEVMTKDIPVIITSADATPGQQERLLAAGADGYMTKPLDIPLFLETVRQRLG
jgi:CheY-like chemotaxis protein